MGQGPRHIFLSSKLVLDMNYVRISGLWIEFTHFEPDLINSCPSIVNHQSAKKWDRDPVTFSELENCLGHELRQNLWISVEFTQKNVTGSLSHFFAL